MKRCVSLLLVFCMGMSCLAQTVIKEKKTDKKKKKKGQEKSLIENVPIPVGHKAEGVTLPYYDERGKLQMVFKIESATRIDDEHLQMAKALVETFDEDGKTQMKIDMPNSVLDLNTRIVTSETPVTISRSDFVVTGETMRFNTTTRDGVMNGNVRMLIYNRKEMTEEKTP